MRYWITSGPPALDIVGFLGPGRMHHPDLLPTGVLEYRLTGPVTSHRYAATFSSEVGYPRLVYRAFAASSFLVIFLAVDPAIALRWPKSTRICPLSLLFPAELATPRAT
jgi:hypothetical protein